jgi:hypothetical protein
VRIFTRRANQRAGLLKTIVNCVRNAGNGRGTVLAESNPQQLGLFHGVTSRMDIDLPEFLLLVGGIAVVAFLVMHFRGRRRR